ncbi:hypothetical protein [Cysteiniphilum halobium]|uniref:hypothetical protein n=1 Tax=Cysteiniphilum halobium TaxID=2219059 RepID=UPI003F85A7C0
MSFGLSDWYLDNETKKQKDQFDSGRTKSYGLARTKSQDEFEKSIFDNKVRRAKYEGGLEKLQAISDYAAQENARINAEKSYDEETRRMIAPYVEGVNGLSSGERRAFMHSIVDRMSEKSNGRLFLKSISDDGLKATVYNNGKLELVDLTRDFNTGDIDLGAVANNSLNYGLRRDDQRIKLQQLDQRERQHSPQGEYERGYASREGYHKANANNLNYIFDEEAGKKAIKDLPKLELELGNSENVIKGMNELREVYQKNPEIFTSPLLIDALSSKEQGVWQNFVAKNPWRDTKLADAASYALKLLNDLHTKRIQMVSDNGQRVTVPIVDVIIKSLANTSLTQGGALKALDHDMGNIQSMHRIHKQQLERAYADSGRAPVSFDGNNTHVNTGGVRLRDPETGEEGVFSKQDAQELIRKGALLA